MEVSRNNVFLLVVLAISSVVFADKDVPPGTYTKGQNIFKVWSAENAPQLLGASNPGNWSEGPVVSHIVGGSDVFLAEFPYVVSLLAYIALDGGWFHICGGTLLSTTKVLTSASCVDNPNGYPLAIAAGFVNFDSPGPDQQFIGVGEITIHPDNNQFTVFQANIAVLTLLVPAILNPNVQTIDLAIESDGSSRRGQECTITGWGSTERGSETASRWLQTTDIDIFSARRCGLRWFFQTRVKRLIKDYHVCTRNRRRSPCFGDAGSGLVCNGRLTAVASWGSPDCDPSVPHVHTRTYSYNDWIQAQTA